jgi:threonine synthase
MSYLKHLECFRCGRTYPPERMFFGCPACMGDAASNLFCVYDYEAIGRAWSPAVVTKRPTNMWRYKEFFPVDDEHQVSLGEGMTPLLHAPRLGRRLGLDQLYIKDESRNPTWSFKDRLACIAVSVAKKLGAPAVVSSSTGNAGASVAAYAAKAGLPCVVFTATGAVGPLVTQMRVYGATVVAVANKADRWPLMQHAVREFGWFPTSPFFGPVVGSNPYGIEGYKTLAYEIAEQMDWQVPDCCVLPVCYGDALIGMWRGFEDMLALGWIDRMPRMMAAEIYGSLGAALHDGGDALPDLGDAQHVPGAACAAGIRRSIDRRHERRDHELAADARSGRGPLCRARLGGRNRGGGAAQGERRHRGDRPGRGAVDRQRPQGPASDRRNARRSASRHRRR